MLPPRLADLPPPPAGRVGWPWTEESPRVPPRPDGTGLWPRISVVTPSFQQGRFIEETIRSVLLQGYPELEYFVLDGGSTDETVAILRRYAPWLSGWQSQPDRGQTHAINQGFARATGELVAWQNADDTYLPGALAAAGRAAVTLPEVEVYYGDKDYVAADGAFLHTAVAREPTPENMIPWPCIHSEVTFMRRRLFADGRQLDESFRHYMDYALFWDFVQEGRRFQHVPGIRATFRQHAAAKTSTQGALAQAEAFRIYRRVLADPQLPAPARRKLVAAMRDECRNDWGSYRFGTLRRHVRELAQDAGATAITPGLAAMTIGSLAGPGLVRACKRFRAAFRPRPAPISR